MEYKQEQALDKIAMAFGDILDALGEGFGLDIKDANFKDTPDRVAKAYAEIFSGLKETDAKLKALLATSFPCEGIDNMVLMRNIRVFSMCPHHFLPTLMKVHLAYIPSKGGKVLGISKLARVAEILAKRPVLQEKYTIDVTETLMKIEGCQGAACFVEGQHCCMIIRGVSKPDAITITSSVMGVFETEPETRAEFFSLVRSS